MNSKSESLSIGEVAKLCKVSTKTLRYYDEIGLFSPAEHQNNTYRKYNKTQLKKLLAIKQLKLIGISLKNIKRIMNSEDINENLNIIELEILKKEKELHDLNYKLHGLRYFKDVLSDNLVDDMSEDREDIKLEKYLSCSVLYTRYETASCSDDILAKRSLEILKLQEELSVTRAGAMCVFFCKHFSHRFFDIKTLFEVFIPIKEVDIVDDNIKIQKEYTCLTTMVIGGKDKMESAYHRVIAWAREHDKEITGESIEEYIIGPILSKDPENYVSKLYVVIKE